MNLRKFLLSLIVLAALIAAGAAYFLPSLIESRISSEVQEKINADAVQVNIVSSPQYMLLLGKVDELDISAGDVKLGDTALSALDVQGRNLDISLEDLLLARRLVISSADQLTVRGTLSEQALTRLLNEKVDGVSDITAQIRPEGIDATGRIALFGRYADLHIRAKVFIEGSQLMLRITDIDTSGGVFGRIGVSFTKDIPLADTSSLPVENAQFTKAEQQNGQVLIEAAVNPVQQ